MGFFFLLSILKYWVFYSFFWTVEKNDVLKKFLRGKKKREEGRKRKEPKKT